MWTARHTSAGVLTPTRRVSWLVKGTTVVIHGSPESSKHFYRVLVSLPFRSKPNAPAPSVHSAPCVFLFLVNLVRPHVPAREPGRTNAGVQSLTRPTSPQQSGLFISVTRDGQGSFLVLDDQNRTISIISTLG